MVTSGHMHLVACLMYRYPSSALLKRCSITEFDDTDKQNECQSNSETCNCRNMKRKSPRPESRIVARVPKVPTLLFLVSLGSRRQA